MLHAQSNLSLPKLQPLYQSSSQTRKHNQMPMDGEVLCKQRPKAKDIHVSKCSIPRYIFQRIIYFQRIFSSFLDYSYNKMQYVCKKKIHHSLGEKRQDILFITFHESSLEGNRIRFFPADGLISPPFGNTKKVKDTFYLNFFSEIPLTDFGIP